MDFENCWKATRDFIVGERGGSLGLVGYDGMHPKSLSQELYVRASSLYQSYADWPTVRLTATPEASLQIKESRGIKGLELPRQVSIDDAECFFRSVGRKALFIIGSMESLSEAGQANVMAAARAARGTTGNSQRTIFTGRWRPGALLTYWRVERANHGSFPIDSSRIHFVDTFGVDVVREEIGGRLPGAQNEEDREALLELILEQTGADKRIIELLPDYLDSSLTTHQCETVLLGLDSHTSVEEALLGDIVRGTLRDGEEGRLLLCLAANQYIRLPADHPVAERLFAAGLLARGGRWIREPTDVVWSLRSPVLHRLMMRQLGNSSGLRSLAAEEILARNDAVSRAASSLVCEIENMLRNTIVLALAQGTTGGAYLDLIPPASNSYKCDQCHKQIKQKQSIRTLVEEGERKARNEICSDLLRFSPMTFLNPSDLRHILLGKLYASHFNEYFPDKRRLEVSFDSFNELRKAVAHNKVFSLRALPKLREVRNYFRESVARAATLQFERTVHPTEGRKE